MKPPWWVCRRHRRFDRWLRHSAIGLLRSWELADLRRTFEHHELVIGLVGQDDDYTPRPFFRAPLIQLPALASVGSGHIVPATGPFALHPGTRVTVTIT